MVTVVVTVLVIIKTYTKPTLMIIVIAMRKEMLAKKTWFLSLEGNATQQTDAGITKLSTDINNFNNCGAISVDIYYRLLIELKEGDKLRAETVCQNKGRQMFTTTQNITGGVNGGKYNTYLQTFFFFFSGFTALLVQP
jgi:hypothetical protein